MQEGKKNDSRESSTKLRACMNCSIIKPKIYFKENGCPNCPFLEINKSNNLYAVTSSSFKGLIVLADPKKSWVGKWQRINTYIPGNYAMTVEGLLKDEFIDKVENDGRFYIDRNNLFTLN